MVKKAVKKWTADDVFSMLQKSYPGPAWALLSQVRNGTGFARAKDRTADALAISCYPSRGLYIVGFEIKVSRSDWLKELADPTKADEMQRYCLHWYIVAPKGIVETAELPETWGLLECDRRVHTTKTAPDLDPAPPDMLLLASILRKTAAAMVPAGKVQKLINEAVRKQSGSEKAKAEKRVANIELDALKKAVHKFEEASGISISNRWEAGDIGAAVKLIQEMGCERAVRETRRLRDAHQRLAERLTQLLSEASSDMEVV